MMSFRKSSPYRGNDDERSMREGLTKKSKQHFDYLGRPLQGSECLPDALTRCLRIYDGFNRLGFD